jgi:hypothetical protein
MGLASHPGLSILMHCSFGRSCQSSIDLSSTASISLSNSPVSESILTHCIPFSAVFSSRFSLSASLAFSTSGLFMVSLKISFRRTYESTQKMSNPTDVVYYKILFSCKASSTFCNLTDWLTHKQLALLPRYDYS